MTRSNLKLLLAFFLLQSPRLWILSRILPVFVNYLCKCRWNYQVSNNYSVFSFIQISNSWSSTLWKHFSCLDKTQKVGLEELYPDFQTYFLKPDSRYGGNWLQFIEVNNSRVHTPLTRMLWGFSGSSHRNIRWLFISNYVKHIFWNTLDLNEDHFTFLVK